MKQRIICKTLAVAVIILFLGVGVQPAIAVTPETTDIEDDCNLCPKKHNKPVICTILFLLLFQHELRLIITKKILSIFNMFPILHLFLYSLYFSYYCLRFVYLDRYLYTIAWEKDCYWATWPPT